MEIRVAGLADAAAIAGVHVASWRAAYPGIIPQEVIDRFDVAARTERWSDNLAGGENTTLVAVDGAGVIGFASLGPSRDDDLDSGAVGELLALYVHPDAWRRGVGRRLCDKALARLAADDFTAVALWVLAENGAARQFYERIGFQPDGQSKTITMGEPLHKLRYRRPIDGGEP